MGSVKEGGYGAEEAMALEASVGKLKGGRSDGGTGTDVVSERNTVGKGFYAGSRLRLEA